MILFSSNSERKGQSRKRKKEKSDLGNKSACASLGATQPSPQQK